MHTTRIRRGVGAALLAGAILAAGVEASGPAQADPQKIGINVLLTGPATDAVLDGLREYGTVLDVFPEINAVTLRAPADDLAAIQALPYVAAANPERERHLDDEPTLSLSALTASVGGAWNLDAIDVSDQGVRTVGYDGTGVYVAVINSGLVQNWREYLDEERIDAEHARAFGGGGFEGNGNVAEQPGKWEHDTHGLGTRLTAILLGFRYDGPGALPSVLDGVAPGATVIPVKVVANSGAIWTSVVTRAVLYAAELKISGALGDAPLVINMGALGGVQPDAVERAAVDYAIAHGVPVITASGHNGNGGMTYPGAYPEVISTGSAGWVRQFPADDSTSFEWILRDVPEGDASEFFIAPGSGRALAGQDLDVVAPSAGLPLPDANNGQVDYTFSVMTGHASPSLSGVIALMLQKNPDLAPAQIEQILESTALPMGANSVVVRQAGAGPGDFPTWSDHDNVFFFNGTISWGANATGAGMLRAGAALAATPSP
jgi:hypothetical protein